ncbi:cellulose-growth-specific protein [Vararia minispora EC-137]|uniref:Cellulose-growth-specific protein n=1 Tax=Vararia minispora EC-137 TaxID=1314806 RepID=A0ACB8QCT0_9AGAM|nr:cellulose-growth-specific protein [Vararia minispora EC-137]
MFALASLTAVASSFLPTVLAHGGVLAYSNAGNWYAGWQPYNSPTGQTTIERPWSTYNPITDATDAQLACNDGGASGALQLTATVAAGSKITAYWNQVWPHPYGPMLTYLAQCPGSTCTGVNSNSLQWFKIDEAGLLSGTIGNGTWGSGIMIQQNSSWTTTIPSKVPSGNYLIRFETIALHSLPAQFYPECAQIQITGGGSLAPTSAELVTFPGAYSNSDPGLTVNLYTQQALTETYYSIPGPPLYAGAQPDYPAPSAPASSAPASTPTTPTGTTSAPGASSTPTGPAVPQYGQCGGIGYSGGTVCASPFTCHQVNAYYSQCY